MSARSAGKHDIRVDGDVIHWRLRGLVELEEVQAIERLLHEVDQACGYVFVVVDAHEGGAMSAEARREAAELYRRRYNPRDRTFVFGAGFMARALTILVMRAVSLFSKHPIEFTLVATEADALARCQRQRELYLRASMSAETKKRASLPPPP